MTICGIVVEYNPFHNGHLHQIEEIRRTLNPDAIFVVMSGQFTQRGMPCITDKHTRSQMALENGVDMVFELPTPFATASADFFASAAVSLLHKTGVVTHLSFGCEDPHLELLDLIATTLLNEPEEVSQYIKDQLQQGVSYPRARENALLSHLSTQVDAKDCPTLRRILSNPNNILGVQYLKALKAYHSSIKPFPIKRTVAQYHDTTITHTIASATAIRKHLKEGDFNGIQSAVPAKTLPLLTAQYLPLVDLDDFSDLLHYKIIFSNSDLLYALWDIPKNLYLSIIHASKCYYPISEMINQITSKTYSRATVSRAILRILLGIEEDFVQQLIAVDYIPYIRVLACKPEAKPLLGKLSKASSVPLLTNFGKNYKEADALTQTLLDLEIRATKLYALKKRSPHLVDTDFTTSIFKVK